MLRFSVENRDKQSVNKDAACCYLFCCLLRTLEKGRRSSLEPNSNLVEGFDFDDIAASGIHINSQAVSKLYIPEQSAAFAF